MSDASFGLILNLDYLHTLYGAPGGYDTVSVVLLSLYADKARIEFAFSCVPEPGDWRRETDQNAAGQDPEDRHYRSIAGISPKFPSRLRCAIRR